MYCDRSAYYQKAIKATARRLKTNTNLQWLFLLFGRLEVLLFFFTGIYLLVDLLIYNQRRTLVQ